MSNLRETVSVNYNAQREHSTKESASIVPGHKTLECFAYGRDKGPIQ